MKRIFVFLACFSILFTLLASACVYWFAVEDIKASKRQVTIALAKGVALSLQAKIDQLNRTLDNIGHDPELIAALENGDTAALRNRLDTLQRLLPGARKLRFLTPATNVLDESEVPHLGYADLELVQQTFIKNRAPVVQGIKGENRHLAIARKTQLPDKSPAVLLASMRYDFLKKAIAAANLEEGLIELRQGRLVMASDGDKTLKNAIDLDQMKIKGTDWDIQYGYPEDVSISQSTLLLSIVVTLCLLMLLGLFVAHRKIMTILRMDQSSILQAIKDMMDGHMLGTYPVHFDELKVIITSMQQYKRIMDRIDVQPATQPSGDAAKLDDLFSEEPENPDLEIADTQSASKGTSVPAVFASEPAEKRMTDENPVIIPNFDEAQPLSLNMPEDKLFNPTSVANAIFRAYDIRGIVDQELTPDMVLNIGKALGSEAVTTGHKTLITAFDGRTSSPKLSESLNQGIVSTGVDVINLGRVPTPVLYFVVHHHPDHCGVVITGSHNPAEYNGLKMIIDGKTLSGEQIQNLRIRVENQDFIQAESGKVTDNPMFRNEYIGAVCDQVHLARPMKVVVDCGNGVTGDIAPTILKTLGCEVVELFCEIDGSFPNHHPDPSNPDNLKDLEAAVKYYQADLGLAFDGDGDRLGVLDSGGKIIWPDRQMMLFASDVLKNNAGSDIIFDVKCTHLLIEQIKKLGGNPVMSRTGHSFMKAKIKETGAKLAGEMSGHIFFNDRWFGFDDALYSACRLIEILSADTRSSQEVFAELPDSVNTPELNIKVHEGENQAIVQRLVEIADFSDGRKTTIDGLRVDFADGWGLVRASNTTPSLVLRFDANDKEALQKIQERFKRILLDVRPDLTLPF